MLHLVVRLVARFGYVLVFGAVGVESMGVPVPGETALVVGAAAARHGHLSAAGVAAAGIAGAILGDNVGYWLGRRYGTRLTRMRGIRRIYTERRLERANEFFARRGWLAVFFGRFVAFLRMFAGPLAGIHHMPWPRFLVANALGAALWAGSVTAIGYALGAELHRAVGVVADSGYVGLAVAVILALGWMTAALLRRRAS